MIKKVTLFSSLLQISKLDNPQLNTKLIKYAYSLKKKTKKTYLSNQGGFQSQNLSIENDPLLKEFMNAAKMPFENYISSYQLADSYEAKIKGLWFNINSKYHYNMAHVHPGSPFVSSYYIQTPKNCGRLALEHPVLAHKMDKFYMNKFTDYNEYTGSAYFHEPQAGDLVFLPAWLPHYVEHNKSDKDRISLSFNIDIQTIRKEK